MFRHNGLHGFKIRTHDQLIHQIERSRVQHTTVAIAMRKARREAIQRSIKLAATKIK